MLLHHHDLKRHCLTGSSFTGALWELWDVRHQIHVKQVGAIWWYHAIMDVTCLSWCIYSNYDPPLFLFSIFFVKDVDVSFLMFFLLNCVVALGYIWYIYIYIHFMIIMKSQMNDYQTPAEVKSWVIWTSRTFQLWWPSNRLLHLQFHPKAEVWAMPLGLLCFPVLPQRWRSPRDVTWYGGFL